MKPVRFLSLLAPFLLLASASAYQQGMPAADQAPFAYPDGYRLWSHVRSGLISPAHKDFARLGGFTHIYANEQALAGYRTREFPEGSIVVVDWLEMNDSQGVFVEGPRRQVDVMVKDARRFASTGGWGFVRFARDSHTEIAPKPSSQDCFACHDKLKKDGLILSSYRE